MKPHKNFIKATSLLILCACVLNGCTAYKSERTVKAERISKAEETTRETEGQSPKIAAPEGFKIVYNEADKIMKVTWNSVAGAVAYEVNVMDIKTVRVETASCTVSGVEAGTSGTIYVRAISKNNDCSNWAKANFLINTKLSPPDMALTRVDGGTLYIVWPSVKYATGYEVRYSFEGNKDVKEARTEADKTFVALDLVEGANISYEIRAYKNINGKTTYSDWARFSETTHKLKSLENYGEIDACTLDLERLQSFAKNKGYKVSVKEDNDRTLVEFKIRDDAQHTAKAFLKRMAKEAVKGVVEGYVEGAKENAVDTAFESDSMKDYFNKLDEEATKNAKKNALIRIFKSLFKDTDIHCVYQFKNTSVAPEICRIAFLKENHKNFIQEFEEEYTPFKRKDGSYRFTVEGSVQSFDVRIGQMDSYWILTMYPSHVEK